MGDQLVSVVVPFYNNVALLGDCLASIAGQTHRNLQVVMVDDGSTDGSAAIARDQAAADPRFELISQRNAGPGAARNRGVAAANGEFLAFVDADDLLPPDAYAAMLAVLDKTGSDFVTGGVLRLSAAGLGRSGLHARAIKARRLRTNISRTPELFYDISVWNKLFRRSFWDAAGLSLPEGMLWEDLVAMTKAHVLARSVDVITDPVYHWRDRDKGAPSITQSRTDIGNIRDRITALRMIDDFLRNRGTPAMLRQHQHKALLNDLWLYVGDLPGTDPGFQREFTDLTAGYLREVTPGVTRDLPAARKLAYYLIAHEEHAELIAFARWLAANPRRTPPMVRVRGRLLADLPLRGDARLAIPEEVFRPQRREFDPVVGVDRLSWQDGSLRIEGWAYVPSMDIGRRRDATKMVALVPRGRRRPPLLLPVRQVRRQDVTAASGQNRYRYDWAGFSCDVPGRLLQGGGRWLTGTWDVVVLVRGRGVLRPARLHTAGPPPADPGVREIAPGIQAGAAWTGGRLQLLVGPTGRLIASGSAARQRPAAGQALEQSWHRDGTLVVRGPLPAQNRQPGAGVQVQLRHLDGWDTHVFDVSVTGTSFRAAIPVGAIDVFGDRQPLRDGRWSLTVLGPDGPLGVASVVADHQHVTIGPKVYRCIAEARSRPGGPDGAGLLLVVGPVLGVTERGRIRRRLLRDVYYRAQRLLPVRDQILFSSFHGKQCGDNPRAIADELRRRGDQRKTLWAITDRSVPVPSHAQPVLIGTKAYFSALARSRYLIYNDHVPLPYRKRAGQRHVQTWHGTPLKRLGYDIGAPSSASGVRYLDYMAGDVAQWDLLVSPNPFSTPIMRRAFRFTGEICETGYPRNDALVAGDHGGGTDAGIAAIRQRLGLRPGVKVAMYVPTWRDNLHDDAGRYLLDFRLDVAAAADRLAGEWVLLIRGHHLMAGGIKAAAVPGFTVDVTGYPDIGDLLRVTDALITDYSSVMFDFAPAGRPMLFFTYDLEQYRDRLRGFYFDFEADAPGPLLSTSDEVVAALADVGSVAAKYSAAHAAFTARFCPLDDGKASARACDRIFAR
ncbi:MAG TPA: bifunctional glycosyltransferase family 2 protein/CDP-glycerol:glycerophosphate glycerophosphotransferase [Streptosporangiaceae bacterium]|nr:bifunctional glycosyltransferase family 2 protein/CDP-glycerol:glycerophosphate glycerophosphotransferase [Streptosporangiaceae bacterium]